MSAAGYNTGFFGGWGLQLQCRVCVCVIDMASDVIVCREVFEQLCTEAQWCKL